MINNRFINYLKYAIGEIILVTIGILIALNINNWNQKNSKEEELLNIYSIIENDLKNDISDIDYMLNHYEKYKPIYEKIINDSFSKADFEKNKKISLLFLGYPEFNMDKRGYQLLQNFNSNSFDSSDSLTNNIISFYSKMILEVTADDKIREKVFIDNFDYWKNNFSWWSDYITQKDLKGFQNYALTNPDFKNRVATIYFSHYTIFMPELITFKEKANKLLLQIKK